MTNRSVMICVLQAARIEIKRDAAHMQILVN